jgi:uncharacterized protein (DUF362 family)
MLGKRVAAAEQAQAPAGAPRPPQAPAGFPRPPAGHPDPFPPVATRSAVALVHGEDRRKNIYDALMAIDDQIRPKLKRKKYVVIKPNLVSTSNQLAATHADTLRGILDYLDGRFKGPVVIAEASAVTTTEGFENYKYPAVVAEYKSQKVGLVDLHEEARYILLPWIDFDLHVQPVRLAARLFDPDAFVFSSAVLKTHNLAVVTLSMKNMIMGSPLHQSSKETKRWNDKRRFHVGVRQSLFNFFLTAQKMQPHWGAAVIDGYEGMEGNGPANGTAVPHRIAIASTDFIAADRVGAEAMGVDPDWLGWLKYSGEAGLGQTDLSKIDIRGTQIAAVQRKYRLHSDIERQLQWRGPMRELPPMVHWRIAIGDEYPA